MTKKRYVVHWNDGNEIFEYHRECSYDSLKEYINSVRSRNPVYTVEAVEEVIEQRLRIDIDGET